MQAKFQTAAKKNHKHTPVMVLTATAPPDVLEILKSILTDPAVYKTSLITLTSHSLPEEASLAGKFQRLLWMARHYLVRYR